VLPCSNFDCSAFGTQGDRRMVRSLMSAGAATLLVVAAAGCGPSGVQHSVAGGNADRGRVYLERYGCGGCHVIPGIGMARGRVGPPLTGVGVRAYLGGVLPNEPSNMIAWIRDPQRFAPGTAMPNPGVSEAEARDIAAYLYTLD
jgi:cytochrome c